MYAFPAASPDATFAVVTPAAVVPEAASPVAPLPPAPDVRTSHWYPLAGALAGAVHETVAVVAVIEPTVKATGAAHEGGTGGVKV